MSKKYFELIPDDTYSGLDGGLTRIRATRDFSTAYINIKEGTLGGYVASEENLADNAWLDETCRIFSPDTRVTGGSLLKNRVNVSGTAEITNSKLSTRINIGGDDILVSGSVISSGVELHRKITVFNSFLNSFGNRSGELMLYDNVHLSNSRIMGSGMVAHDCKIFNLWIKNKLDIQGGARLDEQAHLLTLGPIGSEDVTAHLFRTFGETGHKLTVGCWSGTLDSLMDEVALRRATEWSEEGASLWPHWESQYKLLYAMGKEQVEMWKKL